MWESYVPRENPMRSWVGTTNKAVEKNCWG